MRIVRSLTILMVLVTACLATFGSQGLGQGRRERLPGMRITTSAFQDGGVIPIKYTGQGMSVTPGFEWTNVPMGTVSFVLLLHDPNNSQQKGIMDNTHWLVWNIPGSAKGIAEGQPQGAQLPDGSRQISLRGNHYFAPGAPAIDPFHHYVFELFAIDQMLNVTQGTNANARDNANETRAAIQKAMEGHILGKAVYVGLYHQQ